MKKILVLIAAVALTASSPGAQPGGKLGVAVNPDGALSFLRVNSGGALLLAALGPGLSPVPPGQTGVALDPDGNVAFLHVDSSGGLIVSGAAVTGPITTSGLTESTATMLGRTTAGTGAIEELSASAAKTFLSLNNVENTALSTWAGSTAVTTLGTIATGTWNATAIADGKIASALTGKTYNGLTITSTTGTLTIAAATTLNAGAGGTLGSAAFTAASAYAASGLATASGLTMNTSRILGRTTASAGAVEEISVGASLTLSAGTLNTTQALTTSSSPTFATLGIAGGTATSSLLQITNSNRITGGSDLSGFRNSADIRPNSAGNAYYYTVDGVIETNNGNLNSGTGLDIQNSYTGGSNTVTNDYGLRVKATSVGTNTVTTGYGVKVESMTFAGTNYAIYTGSGLVRFGDNVSTTGSLTTATPAGGAGAAAVKFGVVRTGVALTVSTTSGLQVDYAGTLYTLAVLTTNP